MPRAKTYSRKQLAERASLTTEDFLQINQCRRDYNRLGFAYQVGFVRLMNRFPVAKAVEIIDELLVYTGVHPHARSQLESGTCQTVLTLTPPSKVSAIIGGMRGQPQYGDGVQSDVERLVSGTAAGQFNRMAIRRPSTSVSSGT